MTEAIVELQEAVRLDPQSGESHYQLGLALARAGRKDEGTTEVQKGRELSAADDRNQNANLDINEGRTAFFDMHLSMMPQTRGVRRTHIAKRWN